MNLRRNLVGVVVCCSTLQLTAVVVAPEAQAIACSTETAKFIDAQSNGSVVAGYAEKGRFYVFHRVIESCGNVANTIHMSFNITSPSGSDFIEVGSWQNGGSPIAWHAFCEWRIYPSSTVVNHDGTQYTDQRWIWGRLYTPFGDNRWKCAYTLQDDSLYTGLQTSPAFASDHGNPTAEISRHGDADASSHHTNLQRYTSAGSWVNWPGMQCSQYNFADGGDITDWNAHFISANEWETVHKPVVGAC